MAACGGLEPIFERPLPDSPILVDSFSPWKHVKSMKTVDHHSFTEIFGQLYLKENHVLDPPESSASSSPFPPSSLSSSFSSTSAFSNDSFPPVYAVDYPKTGEEYGSGSPFIQQEKRQHRYSDSMSSMNSDSSSLCAEEVGFESSDDVEDLPKNEGCDDDWQAQEERTRSCTRIKYENYRCKSQRSRRNIAGTFPPPISCIGRNGKPWVCFQSVRQDGRFILKEIRIPTQEFLHSCRKNGRLRMQIIHSDDEILDDDDEEDQDEEDEMDIEQNCQDVGRQGTDAS